MPSRRSSEKDCGCLCAAGSAIGWLVSTFGSKRKSFSREGEATCGFVARVASSSFSALPHAELREQEFVMLHKQNPE